MSASDAPVTMTINGTEQPTYRPTLDSGGTGTTVTYQVGFTITNDPTSTVPFPADGIVLSIGYHDSAQLGLSTGPNTLFSFMDLPNRDTNLTNVTPGFNYAFSSSFQLGPDPFEYAAYEGGYLTVDQYAFVLPSAIPPGGSLTVTFNYTVHALPIANIQTASNLAPPVTVTNQPRSAGGLSTTATAAGWTETDTGNNYGPNDHNYQNFTYLT
ncbi:hypothetical protein [Microbacterium sp. NPDC056052]|uniref:hypothetical protein n=1 Tax=Microbacterium sp. NPDC056052 TaxID=3345695 RepID=UPI0035E281DF